MLMWKEKGGEKFRKTKKKEEMWVVSLQPAKA
jgi:hypothetical protein